MEETSHLRMALGGSEYRIIHRQPFAKLCPLRVERG